VYGGHAPDDDEDEWNQRLGKLRVNNVIRGIAIARLVYCLLAWMGQLVGC
jgi:hypothetical protein